MKRASSRAAAVVGVLLAVSRVASAQTAEDRETARRLFEQGKTRRDAGDAKGALESFRAADALMNVPTTKLAVARAYVALGRLVEARDAAVAVAYIKETPSEPQPFVDARASASQLAAELAEKIPSLTITLQGPRPHTLTIDGEPVPPDAWGSPRRLNPGKHAVVARRGAREVKAEVVVVERRSETLTLDMPQQAEGPGPRGPSSPPPAASRERPLGPLVWIGGGLAAAGLATGVVAGILSMSNKSDADALCRDGKCPPPAHGSLDAAGTWATVSTIGFAAAGAGLALGAVGFAIRPGPAKQGSTAVLVRPGGAAIAGSF
jgi:hypothetical protein